MCFIFRPFCFPCVVLCPREEKHGLVLWLLFSLQGLPVASHYFFAIFYDTFHDLIGCNLSLIDYQRLRSLY